MKDKLIVCSFNTNDKNIGFQVSGKPVGSSYKTEKLGCLQDLVEIGISVYSANV